MKNKINYIIILLGIILLSLIPSCTLTQYTTDPYIYEDHPHSTEVYYRGGTHSEPNCAQWPYWGFYEGFYYYYGIPHFYPWWYYYQLIPPYHYHINTHITIHCDFGYYVYGHRGPTLNNNVAKDFTPTVKLKDKNTKSFVFPRDWKSHNSTRDTKENNWWNKVNMNKTDYNRTFNINQSNNGPKINNKHNNITYSNKNRSNNNKINKSIKNNRTSKKP